MRVVVIGSPRVDESGNDAAIEKCKANQREHARGDRGKLHALRRITRKPNATPRPPEAEPFRAL